MEKTEVLSHTQLHEERFSLSTFLSFLWGILALKSSEEFRIYHRFYFSKTLAFIELSSELTIVTASESFKRINQLFRVHGFILLSRPMPRTPNLLHH